jgi:putative ABC transport system permease protein
MTRPPALARALLTLCLPGEAREVVTGDLEEEFARLVGSGVPVRVARRRYWRLTLTSIAALMRRRPAARRIEPAGSGTGGSMWRELPTDVRYALRWLRRAPGFTAAAVVTLALAIGANTAVFSVINTLLFKPLPYRDADRVAFVLGWDLARDTNGFNTRLADAMDVAATADAFEQVGVYRYWSANLTSTGLAERVQAYRVTPRMLTLLGVDPIKGRLFADDEGRPGAAGVTVLSYHLWQRRFGGDPAILQRRVILDGEPFQIVGVMPRSFEFPVFNFKGELWVPFRFDPSSLRSAETGRQSVVTIGRIRSDRSLVQAQANLDVIARRLAGHYPATNQQVGLRAMPMAELGAREARPVALAIAVAAGLVLLLASANLAGLLFARGLARQRELAVRASLGASRARLVRQFLTESALLGIAGGLAGLGLASAALAALVANLPDAVLTTAPNVLTLGIDTPAVVFTAVVSLAAGVLAGLVPALRSSRRDLHAVVKSAGVSSSRGSERVRQAIVTIEVALAVVLLVAASLAVRSVQRLVRVHPGFDPAGVLTMVVDLPAARYADAPRRGEFADALLTRLRAIPGVESAAAVSVLPFSTYNSSSRYVVSNAPLPEAGREPRAGFRASSPDYFQAMRIPLLAGRQFDATDRAGAEPVAIVNASLERRDFPGTGAVGQRLRFVGDAEPWRTIVGVAGDVRHGDLRTEPSAEIYVPIAQDPPSQLMFAVRATRPPESIASDARRAVTSVDPAEAAFRVLPLERLVDDSVLPFASATWTLAGFSTAALLLAAVGIAGLVAYSVSRQTREIGLRLALGATPAGILRLIAARGSRTVGVGMILGLAGSVAVAQAMRGLLIGVGAIDPVSYAAAAGILALVAVVATIIPARRARLVDPIDALRAE